MDVQTPPRIRSFVEEHLTVEEVAAIEAQFSSSFRPDQQVLWTGMNQDAAQVWADRNDLQTLTTAMGPLMSTDNPACPKKKKSHNQWIQYVHGASALFALRISRGGVVTVLTPPPPERFHPSGATSFQAIEEPIVKGQLGNQAVQRIEAVHPTVCGASRMRYQIWPEDESAMWLSTFGPNSAKTKWREIKQGKIDFICRTTSLTRPYLNSRIAPATPMDEQYGNERKRLRERQATERCNLEASQVRKRRLLRERQKQDVLRLEGKQNQERKALDKKERVSALQRKHKREMRMLQQRLSRARLSLQKEDGTEREALKRKHNIELRQLQQMEMICRERKQTEISQRMDSAEKPKVPDRQLCLLSMQSLASVTSEPRLALMNLVFILLFVAFCLRSAFGG